MLSATDDALVIALVRAHAMGSKEYVSWVPAYTKVRWSFSRDGCVAERVGGHFRRKANCKHVLDALACVCKQPILAAPLPEDPPLGRKRRRN